MARKRMIHPTLWTDSKFLQLEDEAKLLFIGLLCFADDDGIFKYDAITIKCQVLPASNTKLELIESYISSMLGLNMLEEGENKLLRYTNWHNYQKINHPTASKYIFNKIDQGAIKPSKDTKVVIKEEKEDSSNTKLELSEDSLTVKSSIVKDSIDKNSIDKKAKAEKSFDQFYTIYPRKIKRKRAEKAFNSLSNKDRDLALKGLNIYIKYWQDNDVDISFIPYPSTWINGRQWEDQLPTHKTKVKFASEVDKEIYHRQHNMVENSKRMKEYLKMLMIMQLRMSLTY